MKQIVSINIGEPGINIGDRALSLYLQEHQIDKNPQKVHEQYDQNMNSSCLFQELSNGKHTHRSIAVDCDKYPIDAILSGPHRQYYNPRNCIGTYQSTGGVFSGGQYYARRQMLPAFQDQFQKLCEGCDSLQGVVFNSSVLGGSSGVLSCLSQKIAGEGYTSKIPKIAFSLFPSRNYCSNVFQTYNYALSMTQCLIQYFDLVVPFDNESLYRHACSEHDIDSPGFRQINDVVAQFESSVTLSMRSNGITNVSLNDLCTNLVCYPKMHFVYPSLAGSISSKTKIRNNEHLTKTVLQSHSQLYDMMQLQNKIAIALIYRGAVSHFETMSSLDKIIKESPVYCQFQRWSPYRFKVGINNTPLAGGMGRGTGSSLLGASCCSLNNSVEFMFPIAHNNTKFDGLYFCRGFIFHFRKHDLEQCLISDSRQTMAALSKDYQVNRFEEADDEESVIL